MAVRILLIYREEQNGRIAPAVEAPLQAQSSWLMTVELKQTRQKPCCLEVCKGTAKAKNAKGAHIIQKYFQIFNPNLTLFIIYFVLELTFSIHEKSS